MAKFANFGEFHISCTFFLCIMHVLVDIYIETCLLHILGKNINVW